MSSLNWSMLKKTKKEKQNKNHVRIDDDFQQYQLDKQLNNLLLPLTKRINFPM